MSKIFTNLKRTWAAAIRQSLIHKINELAFFLLTDKIQHYPQAGRETVVRVSSRLAHIWSHKKTELSGEWKAVEVLWASIAMLEQKSLNRAGNPVNLKSIIVGSVFLWSHHFYSDDIQWVHSKSRHLQGMMHRVKLLEPHSHSPNLIKWLHV